MHLLYIYLSIYLSIYACKLYETTTCMHSLHLKIPRWVRLQNISIQTLDQLIKRSRNARSPSRYSYKNIIVSGHLHASNNIIFNNKFPAGNIVFFNMLFIPRVIKSRKLQKHRIITQRKMNAITSIFIHTSATLV